MFVFVRACMCVRVCVSVCACPCVCPCVSACVSVCPSVRTSACLCACVCVDVRAICRHRSLLIIIDNYELARNFFFVRVASVGGARRLTGPRDCGMRGS